GVESGARYRAGRARPAPFAQRESRPFLAAAGPVRTGTRAPASTRAAGRGLAARSEIRRLPDAGVAARARPATAVAQPPRLDGEAARDRGCHPCAGLSQLRAGWRAGGLRRTRAQPLRP